MWVSGRVHGVGFRAFVWHRAFTLGLAGFVRNLRDRRVEVVAEGPGPSVAALVEAVRRGPVGARVDGVDLVWETPRQEAGFVIRTDDRE
jgi:acylphosphatase